MYSLCAWFIARTYKIVEAAEPGRRSSLRCHRVWSDYDECQLNSRLCHHVCENALVGYRCRCNLGYQLEPDQTTCTPKRPQVSGTWHSVVALSSILTTAVEIVSDIAIFVLKMYVKLRLTN